MCFSESTVFVKEGYEFVDVKIECTETDMDSFLTEYKEEQEKGTYKD